jgi:hypothetical protein
MRYRLRTLVIWTAIGPPLLFLAYLHAGVIALSAYRVVNAAGELAAVCVPLLAYLSFRRWHWRRHR